MLAGEPEIILMDYDNMQAGGRHENLYGYY